MYGLRPKFSHTERASCHFTSSFCSWQLPSLHSLFSSTFSISVLRWVTSKTRFRSSSWRLGMYFSQLSPWSSAFSSSWSHIHLFSGLGWQCRSSSRSAQQQLRTVIARSRSRQLRQRAHAHVPCSVGPVWCVPGGAKTPPGQTYNMARCFIRSTQVGRFLVLRGARLLFVLCTS